MLAIIFEGQVKGTVMKPSRIVSWEDVVLHLS